MCGYEIIKSLHNFITDTERHYLHPSVNAAYKACVKALNVNRAAFYQNLNDIEIGVSAALLRETGGELSQLIHQMGGQRTR
jgi:hypothetical protein